MIKFIFVLADETENPMMETLNFYQRRMSEAIPDPVFLDFSDKLSFMDNIKSLDKEIDDKTTVILFNNRGFTASFDGKTLYWSLKNVNLVNILVDHPFYYTDMLLMAPSNMKLGLVDRHFVTMLSDWLPAIGKNSFFLPHGGTDLGLSNIPFEERPIDVLYTGSRYSNKVTLPPLDFLPDNGDDFYEYARNMYFENKYIEEDGIVDEYLRTTGREASTSQKIMMTLCLLKSVKFQVMYEMKTDLITALASSGIHLTIHGNGWDNLADRFPEYISIAGWLDSEGCIREMGRAKITLNMMPFFRDGDHERVYNAMLSGSIMISNSSKYLEETITSGKEIFFMDNDTAATADIIQELLTHPGKWQDIKESAYSKASNCTWEKRFRDYIESI